MQIAEDHQNYQPKPNQTTLRLVSSASQSLSLLFSQPIKTAISKFNQNPYSVSLTQITLFRPNPTDYKLNSSSWTLITAFPANSPIFRKSALSTNPSFLLVSRFALLFLLFSLPIPFFFPFRSDLFDSFPRRRRISFNSYLLLTPCLDLPTCYAIFHSPSLDLPFSFFLLIIYVSFPIINSFSLCLPSIYCLRCLSFLVLMNYLVGESCSGRDVCFLL